MIKDPKTRLISALHFRDRVVHHALCIILEPIFELRFIADSYANRKGKGTLAAVLKFDDYKRKISGNGKLLPYAKDNNCVFGYVLKADVKKYFDSVDHEVLMQVIGRRIHDEQVLLLVKTILDNHLCKVPGKGMPIGNMTSQFFANVYLNELDYFVKHTLRAKCYIRYVDDFIILDASKEQLEHCKAAISEFLQQLKLELHPQKSKVAPLSAGVTFLGFRIFYQYKLLKKSNRKRIIQRIAQFVEQYQSGHISEEEMFERLEGWNAYAMYANTYAFRTMLMKHVRQAVKNSCYFSSFCI